MSRVLSASLRFALFVTLCTLCYHLDSHLLAADTAGTGKPPAQTSANRSPASKGSEIRLSDCRITLIRLVSLACDRPGVLKRIEVREGDAVAAKKEVARIADEVAAANLAVAEKKGTNDVDVRYGEKARESAELEYRRSAQANQRRKDEGKETIIALVEVEKLRLAAEKAVLAVEQARHELALHKLEAEQARAELAAHAIVAPFAGIVTRVYKQPGEAVRQGDPIVELVNIDRVRIEGRVSYQELSRVKVNQSVRVKLQPQPGQPEGETQHFNGRVTFIDPVVDPVTRETRVWAEVENPGNALRAGLMAEMTIETEAPADR